MSMQASRVHCLEGLKTLSKASGCAPLDSDVVIFTGAGGIAMLACGLAIPMELFPFGTQFLRDPCLLYFLPFAICSACS
jgi:hypothetical protein